MFLLLKSLIQNSIYITKNRFLFPQLQIFGYNSQLYQNFTDALNRAQGIVAVSVLLQVI